jgi:hypothetical protein
MVYSRITSRIDYDEDDNSIHSEDVGHESSLYESVLFKQNVILTLGKVKFTYIDKGVVYFPIYLVSDKFEIIEKIGIYEIKKNSFLDNVEQMNNEIDMSLLHEPIIFKNTEHILKNLGDRKIVVHKTSPEQVKKIKKIEKNIVDNVVSDIDLGITEFHFSNVNKDIEKSLKDGIFVKHDREKTSLLPDELKETAEQITKSYNKSSNDNWLKKMMKNPNYELKDVHSDNDSLFAVIRDAFEQIGQYTTIQKLRNVVAKHTTKKYLIENRILFSEYNAQVANLRKRMVEIKQTIEVVLKNKIKNAVLTRTEQKDIIDKCSLLKDEFDTINKLKKNTIKIIDDTFGKNFETVTSLEKYKELIVSNHCSMNSNTIPIIERELNIKMIVFSELDHNDQNEVIKSEKYIDGKILYKPDYYIMCSVKNGFYKAVSYKGKHILEFSEIPYHVKIMIIKKNMAGISGKYESIEDFKNYSSFIGIKDAPKTIVCEKDNHMEVLYDPCMKLMFYSKSSNKNAGEGSGDTINISDIQLFTELSCIDNWRQKLDDSWIDLENPITINGKKYASVVHYYQGSKYKNGFPEFSEQFSMDSGSKISKDLSICNSASSGNGSINVSNDTVRLRPKTVVIDPDFYKGRNVVERQRAIDSKFKQNLHLRNILMNTKNAQLNHYIGNKTPEIAIALMKTRINLSK